MLNTVMPECLSNIPITEWIWLTSCFCVAWGHGFYGS